jgi:hypothetical protein
MRLWGMLVCGHVSSSSERQVSTSLLFKTFGYCLEAEMGRLLLLWWRRFDILRMAN